MSNALTDSDKFFLNYRHNEHYLMPDAYKFVSWSSSGLWVWRDNLVSIIHRAPAAITNLKSTSATWALWEFCKYWNIASEIKTSNRILLISKLRLFLFFNFYGGQLG